MSLLKPLAKVRGDGSAREGNHHWMMQRLTAVALVPLGIWFVASLLSHVTADRASVQAWFENGCVTILMLLLVPTMFYHFYLGIKVVIEDYVHCKCGLLTLIIALNFACIAGSVISILAVLKLHLGL